MLAVPFFFFLFFKEVQSDILSGQAGDGVPSVSGTIEPSACWKGTTSPVKQPRANTKNQGTQVDYCCTLNLYKENLVREANQKQ